ncbi:MAG: PilZ domain-containing protein [Vulcanimicrobiota bacterium]
MWQQIKAFFSGGSSGTPVVIEPLGFEDGLLLFKPQTPLSLKTCKIAGPCKAGYLEFEIDVLSQDESGTYRGKLSNETFAVDAMQLTKPKGFRLEVALNVTSPEAKGTMRTEDLALDGARILTKAPLQKGAHLTLKFHFNDPIFEDLSLRSEVKWCSPTRKGLHHSGVRFFMIQGAERTVLKKFIQNKVALGGGQISR